MSEDNNSFDVEHENSKVIRPLISELQIRHRTAQLAESIAGEYSGKDLVIVAVLKGAFIFTADLVRRLYDLGLKPDLDFVRAFSYGSDDRSSGRVAIEFDISIKLNGRHVLIVDDIVDTGRTLDFLKQHIMSTGAADVKSCVMLDKPSRREVDFNPDWIGFEISNVFVVGYGMDYAERYRYLPFITTVDQVEDV